MTEITQATPVRRKTFAYRTALSWTEGRSAVAHAPGRPELALSSPVEFKGEPGRWTPEDLLVAAVEMCTLTTFAALCQKRALAFLGYTSESEGTLAFQDGAYRVTNVIVRPVVEVASANDAETLGEVMEEAHAQCMIGNSLRGTVVVEPTFRVVIPV